MDSKVDTATSIEMFRWLALEFWYLWAEAIEVRGLAVAIVKTGYEYSESPRVC